MKAKRNPAMKIITPSSDCHALHAKLAEAYRDLDAPLYEAQNMARISYGLVEEAIGASNEVQRQTTGNPHLYHITQEQVDMILFAVCHVVTMIDEIKDGWDRTAYAQPQCNNDDEH